MLGGQILGGHSLASGRHPALCMPQAFECRQYGTASFRAGMPDGFSAINDATYTLSNGGLTNDAYANDGDNLASGILSDFTIADSIDNIDARWHVRFYSRIPVVHIGCMPAVGNLAVATNPGFVGPYQLTSNNYLHFLRYLTNTGVPAVYGNNPQTFTIWTAFVDANDPIDVELGFQMEGAVQRYFIDQVLVFEHNLTAGELANCRAKSARVGHIYPYSFGTAANTFTLFQLDWGPLGSIY